MSLNMPAAISVAIGILALLLCLFGYKIRRIICALQGILVGAFAGYIINILVSVAKLAGKSENFIAKFNELLISPAMAASQTLADGINAGNAAAEEASRQFTLYFENLRNIANGDFAVYVIVCAVIMFVLHLLFPRILFALDEGAAVCSLCSIPGILVFFAQAQGSGLSASFDGSLMLFYMPILAGIAVAIIGYAVFDVQFILLTAILGGFAAALCTRSIATLSMNGFFTLAFFLSLIGIIFQLLLLRKQNIKKARKLALRAQ